MDAYLEKLKTIEAPTVYNYKLLPKDRPLPSNLIRLPLCRQSTNYTCGVSCVQSIFAYFGHEYREDNLAEILEAESVHGTDQNKMVALARHFGYTADWSEGWTIERLKREIDQGHPCIVLYQAWYDTDDEVESAKTWKERLHDGHYSVVCGYDDQDFILMDPSSLGRYTYIPIDEFDTRWHNEDGNIFEDHVLIRIFMDKPRSECYDNRAVSYIN
jgi:ABC-type bacteriocin/lantibiotic exporter with double-glycine peptidase domain